VSATIGQLARLAWSGSRGLPLDRRVWYMVRGLVRHTAWKVASAIVGCEVEYFAHEDFYEFNGVRWSGRLEARRVSAWKGHVSAGYFIRRDAGPPFEGQPVFMRLGDTVSEVRSPDWTPPPGCPGSEAEEIDRFIREIERGRPS